ncbi:MAG: ADOP family duplicated permease [Gemmatimonadaceae bacterium]
MSWIRGAYARVVGTFRKSDTDDDFRAEMEAHTEMETAEYVRRGMHPDEARRQAILASGGVTQAVEAVRDQRGLPWLDSIAADVTYALRSLRHNRAFTVIVAITLALGIGANTAIFSVVRGVLLKPLPHRDGDRLVYLRQSADARPNLAFSVPEVRDLRNGAPSLAGLAEYSSWSAIYQSEEGAERISVGLVTGNYFDVMGLRPILGRLTSPADDGKGVPPVAVLTHDFWTRHFGADSGIVGRQITLDKKSVTVIGVLQPAPFFPDRVDALLNMVNSEHHLSAMMVEGRTHRMTEIVARLAPGASLEQTRNEVDAVYTRMRNEHKDAYEAAAHYQVAVLPFQDVLGERARLTVWLLMGAAAFVLIIAVANVANLTLMRGVRRQHELVVRAALGAGVARLRRLLLVENLMLTLLGSTLGIVVALGGLRLLVSLAERYSARAGEITLDSVVFSFMLALSLAVAFLLSFLGSMPREGRFAPRILAGGQRASGGQRKSRLQRGLVVVQVAVSVVLLAGAGLLTRTMLRLSQVDTGLRTEEILTMTVPLLTPTELLTNPAADPAAKERYEQIRRELAALPGVTEVGVGSPMPLRASDVRFDLKVEGKALAVGEPIPHPEMRTANHTFFSAAGIPLVRGRSFQITDGPTSGKVVIIDQMLADQLFPNEDPIGQRIAWTGEVLRFTPISGDWRTVVGVAANTQDGGPGAAPRPAVFMPFTQILAMSGGFVIRTDSNAADLIPAATRVVRRHAPTAPIENVMTIAQYKDGTIAPQRLNATLISSFGALALVIAAVGIAGVLAFSVSARTNEIGIRMSLGADSGRVQRMVLGEGGVLLAIGLVLGITGAMFVGRLIEGLLFGVEPHDPVTLLSVAFVMLGIGLAACWIPALRAARIDPAITMRA